MWQSKVGRVVSYRDKINGGGQEAETHIGFFGVSVHRRNNAEGKVRHGIVGRDAADLQVDGVLLGVEAKESPIHDVCVIVFCEDRDVAQRYKHVVLPRFRLRVEGGIHLGKVANFNRASGRIICIIADLDLPCFANGVATAFAPAYHLRAVIRRRWFLWSECHDNI